MEGSGNDQPETSFMWQTLSFSSHLSFVHLRCAPPSRTFAPFSVQRSSLVHPSLGLHHLHTMLAGLASHFSTGGVFFLETFLRR